MTDGQIHWFSIINSVMIVLFLSGMVAMIMARTLHRDISKYNQLDAAEEGQEETGWKLVRGGVGVERRGRRRRGGSGGGGGGGKEGGMAHQQRPTQGCNACGVAACGVAGQSKRQHGRLVAKWCACGVAAPPLPPSQSYITLPQTHRETLRDCLHTAVLQVV
jgi:hypothetical protein